MAPRPPDGPVGWVPEGTNIICNLSGHLARVFFCVSCRLLDSCGPAEPKEVSAREWECLGEISSI